MLLAPARISKSYGYSAQTELRGRAGAVRISTYQESKRSETHTLRHLQASQRAASVRFVLCQLMVSVVEEISFDVCIEIGADRTFVRRVFDSCSIETLVGHTKRGVEDRSAVRTTLPARDDPLDTAASA